MHNTNTKWTLIAHGGAKDIASHEEKDNREGLREAIAMGSQLLEKGTSAIEVVEEVVKILENKPVYNAGLNGSVLNEDGVIEMDASIMDGETLDIGAIAGIQGIEYPVMVARALLREKTIFLVGDGAAKFAKEKGFIQIPSLSPTKQTSPGCDTVGCVVRDKYGAFAVATSTGGLEGAKAGRVGDVPLPGCGFYADSKRGGVSASGDGESIARVMLASEFLHLLTRMHPDEAVERALTLLEKAPGEAGLIAIAPDGTIGWGHTSPNFAVGIASEECKPNVYLKKSEERL